ncbi:DUF3450 family protein [Pelagicoccus sp. SDUM812002]|uniref:DUF3450 family protein n=1 Tax=Pelagicoccus sp. SDUM812002 TaxID=3041266 RepID=UPI00280ECECD|nr:DUF3450 family protein [Pelagicoccus sp. SDUM812002]MDQ8187161.1 DUF3450 family protein [Pelagicoccus sp. SDUM812002]
MRRIYTAPTLFLKAFALSTILPFGLTAQTALEKAKTTPLQTIELYSKAVQEKAKWQSVREILEHSLIVLEATVSELGRQIEESDADAANAESEFNKLESELTDIEEGYQLIINQIDRLQTATLELARYAPPTLAAKVSSSIANLEAPEASQDISLRIQSLASILINLNQFNKQYTDIRTLHTFGQQNTQEVRILYAGLAQAFALNGDSSKAWVLTPAPDHWVWQEAPEATQEIAAAFKVLDKELPPQLTSLPVNLTEIALPNK